MTNDDVRELITDLRGGEHEACDFCGEVDAGGEYVPEEGGLWACMRCWNKFAAEDRAAHGEEEHHERGKDLTGCDI